MLAKKFVDIIKDHELTPPISNNSILVQASGWNKSNYFNLYYDDKTQYPLFLSADRDDATLFVSLTKPKNLAREIFKKHWNDKNFLESVKKDFFDLTFDADLLFQKLTKKEFSSFENVEKMRDLAWKINARAFFTIYFDREMCDELLEELGEQELKDKLSEIWDFAVTPLGDSFDQKRLKKILNSLIDGLSWHEIAQKYQNFEVSYAYVPTVDMVEAMIKDRFKKFENKKKLHDKIFELEQENKKKKHIFQNKLNNLNEKERKIVEYVQLAIDLRDERKEYLMMVTVALVEYTRPIFKKNNIDENLIYFLLYDELSRGPEYILSILNDLKKRQNGVNILVPYTGEIQKEYSDKKVSSAVIENTFMKIKKENIYNLVKDFKDILGEDPLFVVNGAISPLFLIISWQEKVNPLHIFCINKGRNSLVALNEKIYKKIASDRFGEYFEEKVSLVELQNEYDLLEKDVEDYYQEFTSLDISNLSDDDIEDWIKKIYEIFNKFLLTIYIENVDLQMILSVVGGEYKEKIDAIWDRATEAVFVSFENRRLKKTLDLIASDSKDIVRKAKFIYTDYFWIKDDKTILASIKEIEDKTSEKLKEYEEAYKNTEEKRKLHEDWIESLDLESQKIAKFIQLVMHMRDARKDPLAQIQTILAEIGELMVERAGINKRFSPFVLLYEYIKGISYLKSIKLDIESRDKGVIFLANPDYTYQIENCDFDIAIKQFEETVEHKFEHPDEINGQIACKGNVKGIVRVVNDPHDDQGFEDGDILVTSMTRPEFVPLMKRSGAVITNEGGVTCHAAIVSRELDIPCIIGTKIATKVLKTGDYVEVDANRGIVRIIK
jgi:phosphohistidine swiveling domain-containing protein